MDTDQPITVAQIMQDSNVGFGTSGARGLVANMTPAVCYAYTRAFLQHLSEQHGLGFAVRVAIAGDLRPSTPDIMSAVAHAVIDAGHQPINCGFIPSPAVAYFGLREGIPSVMVTGSHIPDDRNGIKFYRPDGEILKEDEVAMRNQKVVMPNLTFAQTRKSLPDIDSIASELYLRRYTDFFPENCLRGLRLGVYEHSGVARDLLSDLLVALGAEVIRLGRAEHFIPVDTEAIRAEDVELASTWAVVHPGLDAIVSTDGDADRPLVTTEKGEWIRGDVLGILCAHYMGVDRVVTPVSSNTAVERCGLFEQVLRTRIGSPFVIAGMQSVICDEKTVAGYEANGGFLLGSDIERNDNRLYALPTRDAFLIILSVLLSARENGCRLSDLVDALPQRYTASDRIKEFPTEDSCRWIDNLTGNSDAINSAFGNICGDILDIDTTDGLRMTFTNGEIIHLRPSGNAPELRCYTEADSPERTALLNQTCISIMESWREPHQVFPKQMHAQPSVTH
ncbi:phosphomannomutase [Kaarinaea lacus]